MLGKSLSRMTHATCVISLRDSQDLGRSCAWPSAGAPLRGAPSPLWGAQHRQISQNPAAASACLPHSRICLPSPIRTIRPLERWPPRPFQLGQCGALISLLSNSLLAQALTTGPSPHESVRCIQEALNPLSSHWSPELQAGEETHH